LTQVISPALDQSSLDDYAVFLIAHNDGKMTPELMNGYAWLKSYPAPQVWAAQEDIKAWMADKNGDSATYENPLQA
jgi:hypothetical protein